MITDKIFAIDVGTTESGYAIMRFDKDDIKLLSFGKIANEALMQIIKNNDYDQLVYEQFQSFWRLSVRARLNYLMERKTYPGSDRPGHSG